MPNCTATPHPETIELGRLGRRVVEGRFDGGNMTSDGGVMLLGATDRKLGLLDAAAHCPPDPRNPPLIKHTVRDMLRQRVYGLALGWEDLNDRSTLRQDVAIQTAVGVDEAVVSAPHLVSPGEHGRPGHIGSIACGTGGAIQRQLQDCALRTGAGL